MKEIFNDGVLKATLVKNNWLWIEWLTNKLGYLSKTVVKDLHKMERWIIQRNGPGWILASEKENTEMHKLIRKFGAKHVQDHEGYKIFRKELV